MQNEGIVNSGVVIINKESCLCWGSSLTDLELVNSTAQHISFRWNRYLGGVAQTFILQPDETKFIIGCNLTISCESEDFAIKKDSYRYHIVHKASRSAKNKSRIK